MSITNLSQKLSLIEISGLDAIQYLQGQLTNDIKQLDHTKFQYSAHLNNKGRMLASFIITKFSENIYYLFTPSDISTKIINRLKMYILRSKVTINLINTNIFFTTEVDKLQNSDVILELSNNHYLFTTTSNILIIDNMDKYWLEYLIQHGITFIYSLSQELFIPQHVNYDLIGGINYKKGCYTGQEIVARIHYLGKLKRRMYLYTSSYEAEIGKSVVSPKYNNQEVGFIVEQVNINMDSYIGLISLQIDAIDEVFFDINNQQQLMLKSIDYSSFKQG